MKKFILFIGLLFIVCGHSFANPAAINWENISEERLSMDLIYNFVFDYYDYLKLPVVIHDSEFEEEALASAEELYEAIKSIKNPNYDESLFQLIVLRCLYNYDRVSYKEVEDLFKTIDKKYKKNPSHHWVYGNFLGTTFNNLEAIKEMHTFAKMNGELVTSFFTSDCAYISLLSGLILNSYEEVTIWGQLPIEEMTNPELYKEIKNHIKIPDPEKSYSGEEVWKIGNKIDDSEELRLFSTMLGTSLPVKDDWNIETFGYSKNGALVYIVPPAFKVKNNDINISMLVVLNRKTSDKKFTLNPQELNLNNPVLLDEKKQVRSLTFDVYKDYDPEVYDDDVRKGALRYVYVGTTDHKDNNGSSVEYPVDLDRLYRLSENEDCNQVKYYSQKPAYLRFEDEFDVIIIVDSCKAVEKQTKKFIDEFMAHVIFE